MDQSHPPTGICQGVTHSGLKCSEHTSCSLLRVALSGAGRGSRRKDGGWGSLLCGGACLSAARKGQSRGVCCAPARGRCRRGAGDPAHHRVRGRSPLASPPLPPSGPLSHLKNEQGLPGEIPWRSEVPWRLCFSVPHPGAGGGQPTGVGAFPGQLGLPGWRVSVLR